MKFSVNWLREFVELPESTDELADLLTMAGVEIEGIERRGADFDKVVVAQITESKQHPNADRLSVCQVDDGSGHARQIVCGATNYKAGDKVPLALSGAELPGGLKIRASKLRGIESEGMLCSGKELGLGEDASGLLILSGEARIGASVSELFPADTIFDVEITPNRGDLLSHFGLAREIRALTAEPSFRPERFSTLSSRAERSGVEGSREDSLKVSPRDPSTALRSARDDNEGRGSARDESDRERSTRDAGAGIAISAPRECPFYSVRRIENVKVGPSPDWLRTKIESAGIRSINNIVDISNFVMLELGQPTHAFDAATLRGDVNVRLARDREKFLALDGKTYSLGPDNLVIADEVGVVGIAGVMGGEETGVSESTTTVLLESAYFLPASIRRTARNLNLPSDASYRFERGVDPEMILRASQRATELICEIAEGKAAEAVHVAGELPKNPADVSLRYKKVDALLGTHIESKTADTILMRFGLEREEASTSTITSSPPDESVRRADGSTSWRIPSYRRDLQREVDLIEEIVRAHGIEEIASADRSRFTPLSEADREYDFETELRRNLIALGLNEARTAALISRSELAKSDGAIALRNPLSEDHVALRTRLLPGLLGALMRNVRAGAERIALFEVGNVFPASGAQERRLAVAMNGEVASVKSWRGEKNRRFDFVDLKGVLESLEPAGALTFRRAEERGFVIAAQIFRGEERVGICGQLSASEAQALDVKGAVLVAELGLAEFAKTRRSGATFSEIERYPAIRRDIAMFVAGNVTHEQIASAIASAKEPLLERVELFDLFSEKTNEGESKARKSLAYSLTYRDRSRTLTNEEVNGAHARVRERLRKQVGAELRE